MFTIAPRTPKQRDGCVDVREAAANRVLAGGGGFGGQRGREGRYRGDHQRWHFPLRVIPLAAAYGIIRFLYSLTQQVD